MPQVPEPLERQFALASRDRHDRMTLPIVLGTVVGAGAAVALMAIGDVVGFRVSRLAFGVVTLLGGSAGSFAVGRLLNRRPDRLGFKAEELD